MKHTLLSIVLLFALTANAQQATKEKVPELNPLIWHTVWEWKPIRWADFPPTSNRPIYWYNDSTCGGNVVFSNLTLADFFTQQPVVIRNDSCTCDTKFRCEMGAPYGKCIYQ
jgi:hypothetical protein